MNIAGNRFRRQHDIKAVIVAVGLFARNNFENFGSKPLVQRAKRSSRNGWLNTCF